MRVPILVSTPSHLTAQRAIKRLEQPTEPPSERDTFGGLHVKLGAWVSGFLSPKPLNVKSYTSVVGSTAPRNRTQRLECHPTTYHLPSLRDFVFAGSDARPYPWLTALIYPRHV